MNDLRTAAQQALEFIRAMNEHGWLLADYESDMERTVAGLEAALAAQQAEPKPMSPEQRQRWEELAAMPQQAEPNAEYERGFIDGMQKQAQSSVDRAVNRMAEPERHFCERCGKRLSQGGVHTCTPPQQIEQAMLGVWQDVPGAVNFGITGDNNG